MPSLRPFLVPAVLVAALVAPAAASAGAFGPEPIDTGDIRSVGDLDVARDGNAAVAYVKRDDGVDHVYVARLAGGAWQAPERVDPGLDGGSSAPSVAVTDGGRVAVAFASGGGVYTAVRPAGGAAFTAPQFVAAPASEPSVDMSIFGVAYVSFTYGGDVRVARLERNATTFNVTPDALDIDPADPSGHSMTAVSADGTAVVVFQEGANAVARRVFNGHISTAPQVLTADLDGHAASASDAPKVDIEDDSSFAWVVFREKLDDGLWHGVARRLIGSAFDPPVAVDGQGVPSGDPAVTTFIAMNGIGQGVSGIGTAADGAIVDLLHRDVFHTPSIVNIGTTVPSQPVGGVGENGNAFSMNFAGDASNPLVQMNAYDLQPAATTVPGPGTPVQIGSAADPSAGLDGGTDRVGDALAVWVDQPGDRRLVVGGFDRPPGYFRTFTSSAWRNPAVRALSWGAAPDLWGPLQYTVVIDDKPVATTTDTHTTVAGPIASGLHRWKVVATDRRGQTYTAAVRPIRIDMTPPQARVSVGGKQRRGKVVRVRVRASDVMNPTGSGIGSVTIRWGDGAVSTGRVAAHVYRRKGAHVIQTTVLDRAGNATVVATRVRIR